MGRKEEFLKKVERMLDPALVEIDDAAIAAAVVGELPKIGDAEPAPEQARTWQEVARFSLAMNAINHQFWDVVDGKFERYQNGGKVGALAMMEGLRSMLAEAGSFDALERALPLSVSAIERHFGPIPDPAGRAEALTQALGPKGRAAAILLEDAMRDKETWGVAHAQAVAVLLPAGYEDPLLKKAQLCLWMAKGMLERRGLEAPPVDLTCFADYQVPKVLRGMGILKYGKKLAKLVDSGCVLESGGREEVAIRAATVVACERLAKSLGLTAPELDFWLWTRRNDFKEPFHRVRTRKY